MPRLKSYKHTLAVGYVGYITQAVIVNLAPLLFLTFQNEFGLTLMQISSLITINFVTQLLTDLAAAKLADKIGYRACMIAAFTLAICGLFGLAFFPDLFGNAYAGLLTAIIIYAIGGGLLEVLVSPIIESCPTKNKAAMMSLGHSFYAWGVVAMILVSTLFFWLAGIQNWRILAMLWAILPFLGCIYVLFVPFFPLVAGEEKGLSIRALSKQKLLWFFLLLMLCAGATEQAVGQWASLFAENGLGVSKVMGDLLGPCLFAAMMGLSRVLYVPLSRRIPLKRYIVFSAVLCVVAYLIIVFAPMPALALAGCGLCGFAVGILWPGTFSLAAKEIPKGGNAMFALFALAGDAGCAVGPLLVGAVSKPLNDTLEWGILAAIIFPVITITALLFFRNKKKNELPPLEVSE